MVTYHMQHPTAAGSGKNLSPATAGFAAKPAVPRLFDWAGLKSCGCLPRLGVLAFMVACLARAGAQGLPEPSLVLYGSVVNRDTSQSLTSGQVAWQITNQTDSVSLTATIINVNGQFFYVAFVPLETRSLGNQTFSPSPNSLGLSATPTTWTRSATVNGTNAAILFSSRGSLDTFSLGPGDRGIIERVDLEVGAGVETFAQWLARYGLPANTDPNADPLGKGMTYLQQFLAGTDPTDKNSVFKFVDIKPDSQGLTVSWTSFAGRQYTVQRSGALGSTFTNLQEHIDASPPVNSFKDTGAWNSGPHFYNVYTEAP
jgi:hypothetical protein